VLTEKLKRYPWEIERRQSIAQRYNSALAGVSAQLVTPAVKAGRESVWAQYTILVPDRDRFAAAMKEKGVPTSVHYPSPLHHQPVYAAIRERFKCPVAERVAAQVISLPLYADMPETDVEMVIAAVRDFFASR
jgi:UDP-2-acetamido-2-deoxy-ribo-hexuluronate aminotransferase